MLSTFKKVSILFTFVSTFAFAEDYRTTQSCLDTIDAADRLLKIATKFNSVAFEEWDRAESESREEKPNYPKICKSLDSSNLYFNRAAVNFESCAYEYLYATKACRGEKNRNVAERRMKVCESNLKAAKENSFVVKENYLEVCD